MMTKEELLIVKKALKILEHEFNEADEIDELKAFRFIGTRKQAEVFYSHTKKYEIYAKLEQDSKYDNVWYVNTEEIDSSDRRLLTKAKKLIIDTEY